MLSADALDARRAGIAASADLRRLLARLGERAAPLLAGMPHVPAAKALLSSDGGVCPADGSPLEFDPWSPAAHRCPACGRQHAGERHDRAWARFQHLWLAERAAHLAALAACAGDAASAARAAEILTVYGERYLGYPNADNVLGPSRLFFSTYLESIWINHYLAAAALLRDSELLDPAAAGAVDRVAEEAAALIGEFDEGLSNRQTWHAAALAAIAAWFEDEELAARAIEGPTGLIAHLLRGFGDDGLWYEGENYHLFALRGLLLGAGWARLAGVDLAAEPRLAGRLRAALRAPAVTALPDHTFPARKDARYGVSLAQPMYLELWEVGLARLGDPADELWGWLAELYRDPAPTAPALDSYLHEAGEPAPTGPRTRADLSWWALLEIAPVLPEAEPWSPGSALLEGQGLAILRSANRYASLECGGYGGGHGHPDRLHLTLHAGGVHWLPDYGTGSYVSRDLFWYRSTLAHNAPRLDGETQPPGDAACESFDQSGEWAWARGRYGEVARTVVAGPRYLVDLVELSAADDHLLELAWHVGGTAEVATPGRWERGELVADGAAGELVGDVCRFVPAGAGAVVIHSTAGGPSLDLHLVTGGEVLRAVGPGAPGTGERRPFFVARSAGRATRLLAVLEPSAGGDRYVSGVSLSGGVIEVETAGGVDRHASTTDGWEVAAGGGVVRLAGRRHAERPFRPLFDPDRHNRVEGAVPHVAAPPALDGTLAGFDLSAPLALDHEDQYRRSEEPYPGPEEFSAVGHANWDGDAFYLAVEVRKPDLVVRPADAPPLALDNEPDDIHADGLQVYLRHPPDGPVVGFVVTPDGPGGGLRVRAAGGTAGDPAQVRGTWAPTGDGYRVTLAIAPPGWSDAHPGGRVAFDLAVNRALPGRQRRTGQLVWSGGGGWVWLRGDRQDPSRFGTLELL